MHKRDLKEYNHKYYQEHKEEIMEKRAKRLEQRREYHRKWVEEHREEYNKYQKEYHRKWRVKKKGDKDGQDARADR